MAEELKIVISAEDRASDVLNKIGYAVQEQARQLEGLNVVASMLARGGALAMGAAGGIAASLALAGRQAMAYEEAMRNVNSLLRMSEGEFQQLYRDVLRLASDRMITDMPSTLARGLYQIVSAGYQGELALKILEVSSKGAAAGLSDTFTAADALTTIMNAYNDKAAPAAQHYMDLMFKTVEKGKTTFGELASSVGLVAGSAAQAGVRFEEVAAALAIMTQKGIDTQLAVTALNRLILRFLQPSEEMQAKLEELGFQSGLAALQQLGLARAMKLLGDLVGWDADQLAQMLGETRAIRAAMALAEDDGQEYARMLEEMGRAAGATQAALEQQARSAAFGWKELRKQLALTAIEFGQAVLPAFQKGVAVVRNYVRRFAELPEKKRELAVKAAMAVAGLLALSGAIMLVSSAALRLWRGLITVVNTIKMLQQATALAAGAEGAKGLAGALARTVQYLKQVAALPAKQAWAAELSKLAERGPAAVQAVRGLFGAVKALPAALSSAGSAIASFLLNPLTAVVAVSAVAAYSVWRTVRMYREMRRAQEEARQKELEAQRAEQEARRRGYVTYAAVAERLGLKEKWERGELSAEEQARLREAYLAEVRRVRAAGGPRRSVRMEVVQRAAMQPAYAMPTISGGVFQRAGVNIVNLNLTARYASHDQLSSMIDRTIRQYLPEY